ncbi:MAG: hypothetical protein ABTQ73_09565 [Caldilineales bacterium]
MNDDTTRTTDDTAQDTAQSQPGSDPTILQEINHLGQKVATAVQTLWESGERHKAEEEVRKALRMAGERIDQAAETMRSNSVAKDIQNQATRAADAVQKNDVTQQVRQGLFSGLRRLNEELTEFLNKNRADETRSAGEAAAEAGKAAAAAADHAADAASTTIRETVDAIKQA